MVGAEIVIKNQTGLHARPAASLVKLSKKFNSSIQIKCGQRACDAKQLFKMLHCNFKMGETIIVEAAGDDETEALKQLVDCINNFNE